LPAAQADVGFPRLTRTVDFAAHDGDHDVAFDFREKRADLPREAGEVNSAAPAGGT